MVTRIRMEVEGGGTEKQIVYALQIIFIIFKGKQILYISKYI